MTAIDDRRRRTISRRRTKPLDKQQQRQKGFSGGGGGAQNCSKSACSSVSDKLIALKSLIPSSTQLDGEIVKAEQLFQETANYIVRLKAQVLVLQRLVDLYGDQIDASAAAAVL